MNSLSNSDTLNKLFIDDGFLILRNCIDIKNILLMQEYAANFLNCYEDPLSILNSMESLEKMDSKNFYKFCSDMTNIPPFLKIALDEKIFSLIKKLLNRDIVHLVDATVFFNKLSVKRLQYDWHQEKAYFPLADEVITIWFPWLFNVSEENGTMIMAKSANKKTFNCKKNIIKNGLTQMTIEDNDLKDFEKVNCNLDLGDLILFSCYSPHRTGHNTSGKPRTSILSRYTFYEKGKFDHGWNNV